MSHNPYAGRPQNPGVPYPQPMPAAGPPGAIPGQPYPNQPGQPYGQPMAAPGYPPPAYPQPAYPQAAYPQQPAYPTAYPQAGYGAAPAYPQPAYPQQPAYPGPAYPQQPQAAPAYPQPVAQPAGPGYVQPANYAQPVPASPVAVPVTRVAQPTPAARPQGATAPRPIPVSAATAVPTAAKAAAGGGMARPVPVSQDSMAKDEPKSAAEEQKPKEPAVARSAPPWLVSLIVHMLVLIVMGLIVFTRSFDSPLTITSNPPEQFAEEEGVQLLDDTLKSYTNEPTPEKEAVWTPDNLPPVENPLAMPEIMELTPDGTTATTDQQAPVIGLALSGREVGMKRALLGAYGGNATTEAAVLRALEWLAKQQQADGSWSLTGPYSDGSNAENKTAATAMALLAFQGAGYTHKSGDTKHIAFRKVVSNGWKFLLGLQDADGNFFREGPLHARLYSQAQATIAVCELYGMTKDPAFKKPAQLAIDYAVKAQDPDLGGWRYDPRVDSDLSVTGWFMMAMQSAKMAGLEVPSPSLEAMNKFLDKVQANGGRQYMYQPGRGETLPMTAEGLLCRQYLGWKRNDPRLVDGTKILVANKVNWGDQNVYYWYYATQVCHHMEGEDWDEWNAVMRQVIPENQVRTGKEAGSWNPNEDRWGIHGGRLYMTCLCTYMLEVYYRHLPIYSTFTRSN